VKNLEVNKEGMKGITRQKQRENERLKISKYHGTTRIILRLVFVSGELSKVYSLWNI
jgi:hypothetical protein